jgi:hypothetical protein
MQNAAVTTVAVIEQSSGASTFYDDNDGTMGWAYGSNLTVAGSSWFVDYAAQANVAPIFSICMGWTKGWLSFGVLDRAFYEPPIVYTPIVCQRHALH